MKRTVVSIAAVVAVAGALLATPALAQKGDALPAAEQAKDDAAAAKAKAAQAFQSPTEGKDPALDDPVWSQPLGPLQAEERDLIAKFVSPNLAIDEKLLSAHVIRYPGEVPFILMGPGKLPLQGTGEIIRPLDTARFSANLTSALGGAPYYAELRQNGSTVFVLQSGWGRQPADSALAWNSSSRMHVASVSKLITAMALTRLLRERGLSWDEPILPYLPDYWAKGPRLQDVTFRHLLTHTAGLGANPAGDSSFVVIRRSIAAGSTGPGSPDRAALGSYANVNFGLMRVLIAVLNGDVRREARFNRNLVRNDGVWDFVTQLSYVTYVRRNVFDPAGVTGPTIMPPTAPDVLAYTGTFAPPGWDSDTGNGEPGYSLGPMTATVGWHFTPAELLAVMRAFRDGRIVPPDVAEMMLAGEMGIDATAYAPGGAMWSKSGAWGIASGGEYAVASFLPDNMELVVFANSAASANLFMVVQQAYTNSFR